MRVLMTADPIGGVWTYALELCAAVAAEGIEVCLATLGRLPSPAQRRQVARLRSVTLHTSSYRLEWMQRPWDDLARAGDWLLSLEDHVRPDVVHLNHLVHADLPWNAPVLSVGHSCVLSWWAAVRGGLPSAQWSVYRRRVTRSLQAAHCVIAPTHAMLDELERFYGIFRNASVVHNASTPRLRSAVVRERLVLSAGRVWDPAKNIEALAAVAPQLAAPVVVAGETRGPQGEVATLSAVRTLGVLQADALAEWYARAAVYALPARYEPFGLTVLEAAQSGCALVLGNTASLREVWGDAAWYVAPDDREALRDAVNALLTKETLRCEMAARARSRAAAFEPRRFAQQYVAHYRGLVHEHGAGRVRRFPVEVGRCAAHET